MKNQSRRTFIKNSGTIASGSWLSLNIPLVLAVSQAACARRDAGEAWQNLNAGEAAGFAAIAEQIFPADESPGAVEIGVVYFLDEALNDLFAKRAKVLKGGLAELNASVLERFPAAGSFAELPFDEQTKLLKEIEHSPMFRSMMMITRFAVFALPEYGGNKDHAGWKLIGFEHQHTWQPPFGYYDEQYTNGEADHVEA